MVCCLCKACPLHTSTIRRKARTKDTWRLSVSLNWGRCKASHPNYSFQVKHSKTLKNIVKHGKPIWPLIFSSPPIWKFSWTSVVGHPPNIEIGGKTKVQHTELKTIGGSPCVRPLASSTANIWMASTGLSDKPSKSHHAVSPPYLGCWFFYEDQK